MRTALARDLGPQVKIIGGRAMSLRSFRIVKASTVVLAFILINLGAQQSKVFAPHKPVAPLYTGPTTMPPPTLQIATGAFWMTDANLKSTLYLQNQLKTDSLR